MKVTDEIRIPQGINAGLNGCGNAVMLSLLGNPRNSYSADCRPVTHPKLSKRILTDDVGPFRVTGFDLALADLKIIFAEIKAKHPMEYATLGTAGMLCARLVRGSGQTISNHSWGCALDITLARVLDQRGDNMVQAGLAVMAPIFNAHGWYWGAGFPTEDGMHFEVSRQKLEMWKAKGLL